MRVYTRAVYDIESGALIAYESYNYDGPVEHLGGKQGRGSLQTAQTGATNVGSTAQNLAGQNTNLQSGYRGAADPFAESLIPKNGGLSPYAASQYAAEKNQIAKTYADAAQTGLRQLGNRGLAAPGSSASIVNTADQAKGAADTAAYQNAMQNTLGQGLEGIRYMQGQQQLYNPNEYLQTANNSYGVLSGVGQAQNQMGSPLSAIGQGLSTFASMAPAAA